MHTSTTMVLHIRSSVASDLRRIKVANEGYPFQPQIGGRFILHPVGEMRICPEATITEVEYPISNYFNGPLELSCGAELHHEQFSVYCEWLLAKKESVGLTHQWGGWSLYSI